MYNTRLKDVFSLFKSDKMKLSRLVQFRDSRCFGSSLARFWETWTSITYIKFHKIWNWKNLINSALRTNLRLSYHLILHGLPGASPPGPPPGLCPWTPPGALTRAPGPHAFRLALRARGAPSVHWWFSSMSVGGITGCAPPPPKSWTRHCPGYEKGYVNVNLVSTWEGLILI